MQAEPKIYKHELNRDLTRINSRIAFIRACFLGKAIEKAFLNELAELEKLREFVLSELKK